MAYRKFSELAQEKAGLLLRMGPYWNDGPLQATNRAADD
jgi:hypothetical protein